MHADGTDSRATVPRDGDERRGGSGSFLLMNGDCDATEPAHWYALTQLTLSNGPQHTSAAVFDASFTTSSSMPALSFHAVIPRGRADAGRGRPA
jgi:hypothetical protein